MIQSKGYTIRQDGNRIIIQLPQTKETLNNPATPISDRKPWLSDVEQAALLYAVVGILEGSKHDTD